MKKILLIIVSLLLLIGCTSNKEENNIIESDDFMDKVNITINNKEYILELEDNETTREFLNTLPLNITMEELNGNEKYIYLDNKFTTNSIVPEIINKGDVMLYGNNCLIIFYKTFTTTYSYTKIGHINNLEDLDNNNIIVTITK